MKLFEIRSRFDGKVLFSLETESIKITLEAAVKGGADLRGAYLGGAKSYVDNHDFFGELVQRKPIETFTDAEWAMIGQLIVHRYCWGEIHERHGQPFLRVLEVLEADGFGEYAVRYREVLMAAKTMAGASCSQAQEAKG